MHGAPKKIASPQPNNWFSIGLWLRYDFYSLSLFVTYVVSNVDFFLQLIAMDKEAEDIHIIF